MKKGFLWKLARLTAAFAVLLLCFYAFNASKDLPQRPVVLSDEDYKLHSPQKYEYVLNQPRVCSNRSEILVVFLVPVAPERYAERQAVRQTWGAPGPDTLTLFFLGLPEEGPQKSEVQGGVETESRAHGDIIQANFLDTYPNLTVKTVLMMRWLDAHCPQTRFGMKVDADIFVNVFYLRTYLRSCPRSRFITGSVINDGRPRRGVGSKWRLTEEQYAADSFPPYVSGAGYVFSWDLAGGIWSASRSVRPVPLEDVYVGLCLRLLEVRPRYAFSLMPFPRNLFVVRSLQYERCAFAKLIIVNGFEPSELLRVWDDFKKGFDKC